jgi:hypothetical protein
MRRITKVLLCAAGSVWFVAPPGPAFAQEAVQKLVEVEAARRIANEVAVVQQFEQQFAGQFRQLYRTELHFMRVVCQPTKEQYDKIAADGEAALKATIKKFAGNMRGGIVGIAANESDPREPIVEGLAKSVRATLAPEQAARYQKELDQRASARKRVILLNLVAKVDKVLVLTTEQRDKLVKILENKWPESWNQTQMLQVLTWGGSEHFAQKMPDGEILPILTENQKTVWRGIPKEDVRFGFDIGFLQGIEIGDEVWDEIRLDR